MRVLHLDSGREMRGGQWQVLRLVEAQAAAGVEATLLARADAPLLEAARERGLRAWELTVLRLARFARSHDLVHAHDARTHTLAALAGGAPLVVSRRVAFPVRSRWKYARPARYLAVSEFVRGKLVEGGVQAEKIEVVYDGVPLLDPSRGGGVLAPATDDPAKGADLARDAARAAGVEIEFSRDLERDLARAGVLLYLSYAEGLGSGALLAMAAGVPAIASKVGGIPEIVRHGETGLLVENAVEPVAAALRELAADPARARAMGERARADMAARFTVDRMLRRTMEVYRQVLS
jgi:hypothetical protein